MKLLSFLEELLTTGTVTVLGSLSAFEQEDLSDSVKFLEKFYHEDVLTMPSAAPAFSAEAAIWAAQHAYLSLQLVVLRDITEEIVNETLEPFEGTISPSVIYSADLVLRYLPDFFNLAKGLAPADIMVKKLTETAAQWPFSSVGIPFTQEVDDSVIISDVSLRTAYTDRIIKSRDLKRISNNDVKESVLEVLGNFTPNLWPGFHEHQVTITNAR